VIGCCPDGLIRYEESCYHFSHDTETWADAVVSLVSDALLESPSVKHICKVIVIRSFSRRLWYPKF